MGGGVLGVHLECLCRVCRAFKEVIESVCRVGGVRVDLRGFSASILPSAVFLPTFLPLPFFSCLSDTPCLPISSLLWTRF